MKITKIGFGYVKSLGNYENCKLYLEAQLEDWENPEESMTELRNRVARELDLPDQWHDLKRKFAKQLAALTDVNERLERANKQWEAFGCFLAAHGVNPATLALNPAPGSFAKELAETEDEEIFDDEDGGFDPYEYYPVNLTDKDEDEIGSHHEF